jgi:uncharacterized repeat protein (TIGR01451 family)
LTVQKTAAVYYDPITGVSANAKAIPGAIMTYTITITNAAGAATATSVSISDSLDAEIVAGHLSFNTQFAGNAPACNAGEGITLNGACMTNTNGDGDGADFTANAINVSGLSIPASNTATIRFQAVVQ